MAYTYEDMQDINGFVGPWTCDVEMPDGTIRRFGYEAPAEVEYPERWDAEHAGFVEDQREMDGLDRRIVAAYAKEMKEVRAERLSRIMLWIARAPKKALKRLHWPLVPRVPHPGPGGHRLRRLRVAHGGQRTLGPTPTSHTVGWANTQ